MASAALALALAVSSVWLSVSHATPLPGFWTIPDLPGRQIGLTVHADQLFVSLVGADDSADATFFAGSGVLSEGGVVDLDLYEFAGGSCIQCLPYRPPTITDSIAVSLKFNGIAEGSIEIDGTEPQFIHYLEFGPSDLTYEDSELRRDGATVPDLAGEWIFLPEPIESDPFKIRLDPDTGVEDLLGPVYSGPNLTVLSCGNSANPLSLGWGCLLSVDRDNEFQLFFIPEKDFSSQQLLGQRLLENPVRLTDERLIGMRIPDRPVNQSFPAHVPNDGHWIVNGEPGSGIALSVQGDHLVASVMTFRASADIQL